MKTKLQWADEMRCRGMKVFPLQPNSKKPFKGMGVYCATLDPDIIEAWWTKNPDANIGVAPGDGSVIVDLDEHTEGISGAKNLRDKLQDEFLLQSSFVVRTQSGGFQVYYRTPENFANNAGKVLLGVDIRSRGGYGIAPGSTIDGRAYSIHNEAALEPLPDALRQLLTAARERASNADETIGELDTETRIARAIHWLKLCKRAIEGEGGDAITYATAAKLKALGISEAKALELMLEHWNDDCDPPWDADELAGKVANGFIYAKEAAGSEAGDALDRMSDEQFAEIFGDIGGGANDNDPKGEKSAGDSTGEKFSEDDFGNSDEPKEKSRWDKMAEGLTPKAFAWTDPKDFPRRQWLYGDHYIRKFPTATSAPGGVGKSALKIVEALAMTSNKPLLGALPVNGPLRVWIANLEDPREEMERRALAAMIYHKLTQTDIGGRLFITGRDQPMIVASEGSDGLILVSPVIHAALEFIRANKIDVLIVDPFISCHELPENDNSGIDTVAKEWGRIAEAGNCSVELVHHVRKAGRNDKNENTVADSRGAGALADATRSHNVLNRMTKKEGTALGIAERECWYYFRQDDGKPNMARRPEKAAWFHLVDVALGNGDDLTPGTMQDHVGVVEAWQAPECAIATADHIEAIKKEIGAGEWRRDIRAKDKWAGVAVARVLGLDAEDVTARAHVRKLLDSLIVGKYLEVENRKDASRHERAYVIPGPRGGDDDLNVEPFDDELGDDAADE